VSLGAALVGDPPVLLLDEPTVGLDPAQSAEARRLIGELGRERAVLVSSHVLSDLESLCDRVVVLHQGRVLADGAPDTIAPRLRRTRWVDLDTAATPARLADVLRDVPGVRRVERPPDARDGTRCRVEVNADRDVRAAIAGALARAGIELYALVPVEPSLEEAFLSLVGEPPGEEAAS
jgi:ABC-2 type transport system ATP-binding protein